MIRYAVIDANESASKAWRGVVASVVGQWLRWELGRAGCQEAAPAEADCILVAYAGSMGWLGAVAGALRAAGVDVSRVRRGGRPYVVAGGDIATAPALGLSIADAIVAGEGYGFMRALVRCGDSASVRSLCEDRADVLTATDLVPFDAKRPWLLEHAPVRQVVPDDAVDWAVPAFTSGDRVTRIVASKGCHKKCAFCATTYRQAYQINPQGGRIQATMRELHRRGGRAQLVSNDPANLPWFTAADEHIDSGSFTIDELRRPDVMAALERVRPSIARLGVEGLSERMRAAFGKPIRDDELVEIVARLTRAGINWHWFMVVGAPYETGDDWEAFRGLVRRVRAVGLRGLNRIKMTAFTPAPPAPLSICRPSDFLPHLEAFRDWLHRDCVSANIVYVWPRRTGAFVVDCVESLGLPHLLPVAREASKSPFGQALAAVLPERLTDGSDADRLPWQLVQWPLPLDRRLKVAEVYRRRMAQPIGS